jgi:hypothetical protein
VDATHPEITNTALTTVLPAFLLVLVVANKKHAKKICFSFYSVSRYAATLEKKNMQLVNGNKNTRKKNTEA